MCLHIFINHNLSKNSYISVIWMKEFKSSIPNTILTQKPGSKSKKFISILHRWVMAHVVPDDVRRSGVEFHGINQNFRLQPPTMAKELIKFFWKYGKQAKKLKSHTKDMHISWKAWFWVAELTNISNFEVWFQIQNPVMDMCCVVAWFSWLRDWEAEVVTSHSHYPSVYLSFWSHTS